MTCVASLTGRRDRNASITPGQYRVAATSVARCAFDAHDAGGAADRVHAGQPIDGLGERRVGRAVRDEHQRRGVAPAFLADGLDADVLLRERTRDAGEDTWPVRDVERDVVARDDLAHGKD